MALAVAQTASQTPIVLTAVATATLSGATTVGHALIAVAEVYGSADLTGVLPTDSKGNTWTQDYVTPAPGGTGMGLVIASTILSAAGAAHAVTFDGGAGPTMILNLYVVEASGVISAGRFDAAVRVTANSAPPYTAGPTGTLGQADELLLAMVSVDVGGTAALTQDPTWALIGEQENGTDGYVGSAVYKIVSATTPVTHVWTGAHASAPWLTVVAGYKALVIAGEVSGTVASTEAADVSAITGVVTGPGAVAGSLAVIEAPDAVAIVGTVGAPTSFFGTVAAVEASDTSAIVATYTGGAVTGTIVATEADDSAVIVGYIPGAPGSFTQPLRVSVATVRPELRVSVSLPSSEPVVPPTPISGVVAGNEAPNIAAIASSFTPVGVVSGSIARTEASDTSAITGTFTPGGPTVLLFDDFLGTSVDTSKWIVYDRISDQVNGERNCCVSANVTVASSRLLITARTENYTCEDHAPAKPSTAGPTLMPFTSGQVSQVMPSFLYGTVDFRAKIPPGTAGLWPCMWMLGDGWKASQPFTANTPDGFDNWPSGIWWEIDVAEFMNNSRGNYSCTVHYPTAGGNLADVPADPTTRFMVYRLKWEAGRARFYIDPEDGRGFLLMADYNNPAGVPNTPGYVTINCPVGGKGGVIDGGPLPLSLEIDYVRITQP